MFRCILVPLDGSLRAERAIPVAAHLARASQGMLILLRVVSAAAGFRPGVPSSPLRQAAIQNELDQARQYLKAIASSSQLAGLSLTVAAPQGSVVSTIQDIIQTYGVDLVVLCEPNGPQGVHPLPNVFVEQLLAHLSVPLLLLPGQGPLALSSSTGVRHPITFLVAFDGPQPAPYLIEPTVALEGALTDQERGQIHFVPLASIVSSSARMPARQQEAKQSSGNTAVAVREAQPDAKLEEMVQKNWGDVFVVETSALDDQVNSWLETSGCLRLLVPSFIRAR